MTNGLIVDPIEHTGTPTEAGVYVTAMKGKLLTEEMRYYDGRHWGHPGSDYLAALQGLRVGDKLPFYKQQWRGTVARWKRVTITPKGKDEILKLLFGVNP